MSLKLRIYKSVFYPMVMYALHHSWLTKGMCRKLDSWQARTLRRVLRVKASMISKVSNAEILRRSKCTPLSAQVRGERYKYFGHVLRRQYPETIVSVCCDSSYKLRPPAGKRRRRRPLDNWTRKVTTEVLATAPVAFPPSVRPSPALDPTGSGILYARNIAQHRQMWQRLVARQTYAPAGGWVGPGARLRRAIGGPAASPPGGAR